MDASIIIVNWNTKELLQVCLEGLFRQQDVTTEIFVVDNNSNDGSVEMIRGEFPHVQLIANTTNRGFAAANNQALRLAKGECVMLVNPDIEFTDPHSLRTIVDVHRHRNAGIVGPRLLHADHSVQPSVRRDPEWKSHFLIISKFQHLFPRMKVVKKYFAEDFDYNKEQTVEQISGAFFSIRKEVLGKVGFLDERFWIWFEEVDFCTRAKKEGFTIIYTPKTEVIHHGGQSFQRIIPKERHVRYSNSLLLYAKKYFTPFQRAMLYLGSKIGYLFSILTPKKKRLRAYQ